MVENSAAGKYAERFRKRYREQFDVGVRVRIAKSENLVGKPKEAKGRFTGLGRITDSLVRKDDGKIVKKRHYDLKEVCG